MADLVPLNGIPHRSLILAEDKNTVLLDTTVPFDEAIINVLLKCGKQYRCMTIQPEIQATIFQREAFAIAKASRRGSANVFITHTSYTNQRLYHWMDCSNVQQIKFDFPQLRNKVIVLYCPTLSGRVELVKKNICDGVPILIDPNEPKIAFIDQICKYATVLTLPTDNKD